LTDSGGARCRVLHFEEKIRFPHIWGAVPRERSERLGSYDPLARTFTPGADSDIRTTSTEGTTANPDGIANRTTRSVSVADRFGKTLYTGEEVYDGATYHLIRWSANTHDSLGRVVRVDRSDGSWVETGYDCCGQSYVQSSDGSRTEFFYDDLQQIDFTIDKGVPGHGANFPPQPDVTRDPLTDAFGRQLSSTTSSAGLSLTTTNTYDSLGRLLSTTDPAGLVTSNKYDTANRTHTVYNPDSGTQFSVRFLDGQSKSTSGSATHLSTTTYGVLADGTRWTRQARNGGLFLFDQIRYATSFTDFLGRSSKTERQTLDGTNGLVTVTNQNHYDAKGRLWKTSDTTDRADTLLVYDELGTITATGLDLNGDGVLDAADRFTSSHQLYAEANTNWFQISWSTMHTGALHSVTTSVHQARLTGLSPALASESISTDIHGNTTKSTSQFTTLPGGQIARVDIVDSPYSTQDTVRVTYNGLTVQSTSATGLTHKFRHDALRRQIHTIDPRTGTNTIHYAANGRVDYTQDAAGYRTTYGYDAAGRRNAATDPNTNTIHSVYSLKGEMLAQWGATYPVLHEFNAFNGDRTGLYTLRDTNVTINSYADLVAAKPVMDKTTWIFEPATGQLTAKRYADGHGPDYTYHTDGKLATRTWARTDGSGNRIKTTYSYTPGTRQLETTTYSDGTPSVSNAYHQITGQMLSTTDASGQRSYTHNDKFQVLSEIHNGLLTNTLTRAYDPLGRPAGHTLYDASGNPLQTIVRGFDDLGRSASVLTTSHHGPNSPSTNRVDYGYLPDSDLLHSTAHTIPGGSSGVTAHIKNYEPHRNLIDRIDNLHGTSTISIFDYHNDPAGRRTQRLDEALGGAVTTNEFGYNSRSELASAQMGSNLSTYNYDHIGNRTSATQFDGSFTYDSNQLNQYTNIVNTLTSEISNPTYDLDGNMLDINGFTATWNGENRLTTLTKTVGATTTNLTFAYDSIGRRVRKLVTVNGTTTKNIHFLYDSWNLLLEKDIAAPETTYSTYTWGLNLLQTGQRLLGGLLSLHCPNSHRSTLSDANGNVVEYVDASGVVKAGYEYDGFGLVEASGPETADMRHQFSSKYLDREIGANYFGFRYYQSKLGRWSSRDPISVSGGLNTVAYVNNRAGNFVDALGLYPIAPILPAAVPRIPLGPIPAIGAPPAFVPPLPAVLPALPLAPPVPYPLDCIDIHIKWNKVNLEYLAALAPSVPHVHFHYKNNPFQHCVWNCRMTQDRGILFAEKMSLLKEYSDWANAAYGIELKAAGCWHSTPLRLRDTISGGATSAFQDSDFQHNQDGRACGAICPPGAHIVENHSFPDVPRRGTVRHCEGCCAKHIPPNSSEGPLLTGATFQFGPAASYFPLADVFTLNDSTVNAAGVIAGTRRDPPHHFGN